MLESLPKEVRKKLIRRSQPSWVNPMLATLTDERFSDKKWIFEKKHDGVRALAFRKGNDVRLFSRNKLSFTNSYPEIVQSLREQRTQNFIFDWEIVAVEKGVSSFAKLQQRGRSVVVVCYFVFDLLYLDGYDTTQIPLAHRKRLLQRALTYDRRIRFTTHRLGLFESGRGFFTANCSEGH